MNRESVIRMTGSIRDYVNRFYEKELRRHNLNGLVESHGAILEALYKNRGKLRITELSTKIGRSKSTVTGLVNKMERNGFIRKVPSHSDRRIVYVILTEKGMLTKSSFDKISEKLIDTAYHGVPKDERDYLEHLLTKIRDNVEMNLKH